MGSSTQFIIETTNNNNNIQSSDMTTDLPPPFRRWNDQVITKAETKFTANEMWEREAIRKGNFERHTEIISKIAQKNLKEIESLEDFKWLQPLTKGQDVFATGRLPVSNGMNIFDAIFTHNKNLPPQEQVALAEHFIEKLGYYSFLKELKKEENQGVIIDLIQKVSEPSYLEFIQRFYIAICRETKSFFNEDHPLEMKIFTAIAANCQDGGKQFFANLIANDNLSQEKIQRYLCEREFDLQWIEFLTSLRMLDFLRDAFFHTKQYSNNSLYSIISTNEKSHEKFFAILCEQKKYVEMYTYIQVYLQQFNEYKDVLEKYEQLIAKLPPEIHGAVKKYADLRLLKIGADKSAASMNTISGLNEKSIPEKVDEFLNPEGVAAWRMRSKSAYKIMHNFFDKRERKEAQKEFNEKIHRVTERLSEESRSIHQRIK